MDETAAEPGAAGSGAADAVCLKLARCGGITGVLRDAEAARAAGSAVYVASSFDGPLGIAAGVHVAAALGRVPWCGLATLGAFAGHAGVLAPERGAIAVPTGPGPSPSRLTPQGAAASSSTTASGASRCAACPAPDDLDAGARQRGGHPLGDRAELPVALAHHEVDGDRQLPQAVPQRGITPVPSPRSAAASPPAVLRRGRRARLRDVGGMPANSGCAPHSRAKASIPIASMRSASAASAAARAARSAGSASPGLAPTSTSRRTRAPARAPSAGRAGRPSSSRPADGAHRARYASRRRSRPGRRCGDGAVAGRSGATAR